MSKSPWGNIGAWAAEAERAEAEEREEQAKAEAAQASAQAGGAGSFPSLREAVNTSKQKKKTKMSLQEFTMQKSGYGSAPAYGGLTHEEMLRLPTGPKERSPEEMQYSGRGFSSYGSARLGPGPGGPRTRDYDSRRSYGGFDDDNRRGPIQARGSEFDQPSRADGVDNWASMKNALPDYNTGAGRTNKYSSLGGGSGGFSRADEVDNWAASKKPISQPPPPYQQQTRSSSFGSGFSRPDSDRWTRDEPQRLVLDSPKNDVEGAPKVNKPNPFGAARPREDVLAEKGKDWKKLDMEIEEKKLQSVTGSRPTSSQSSRPGSAHSSRSEVPAGMPAEGALRPRPKVNPFGDAKPREVLLEQKGRDWKKIDLELEHRRVDRPDTEEEKILKEKIENLKKELLEKTGEEQTNLQELIVKKEKDLETLTCELDDRVRYSQKVIDRPGSGAGRAGSFSDRPPSRPGSYEEPKAGYADRPPSRPGSYEDPRSGYTEGPDSRPGYEEPRSGYSERLHSRPAYEDRRSGYSERSPTWHGAYEQPRGGFPDWQNSRAGAYEESRAGFPERSPSIPGTYDEPRAVEYVDRPRSRGSVNSWTRQSDERRSYQGARGFLGSRDNERSRSRW